MTRPVKVLESERSTAMVLSKWKQDLMLSKNLKLLDSSMQLVVNRITLNQRLMLKQFKRKSRQADLRFAYIMGDKDKQAELRGGDDILLGGRLNTNVNNPDDEDLLEKIWSRSRARLSGIEEGTPARKSPNSKANNRRPSRPGTDTSLPLGKSSQPRPVTVVGASSKREWTPMPSRALKSATAGTGRGQYIATGLGDEEEDTHKNKPRQENTRATEDDQQDVTEQEKNTTTSKESADNPDKNGKKHTHFLEETLAMDKELRAEQAMEQRPQTAPIPTRARTTSIFDKADHTGVLLNINRDRLLAANYDTRVRELCGRMAPYRANPEYVPRDYYSNRLDSYCLESRGRRPPPSDTLSTPEVDVRKSSGNPRVRSLTMRSLVLPAADPESKRLTSPVY